MDVRHLLPPQLDPAGLYDGQALRDATRIRAYNSVLNAIYARVRSIARVPGNPRCLYYLVPEFIPGVPRLNMQDAVVYLVWNLRNAGYSVEYTHPNLVWVSWEHHEAAYNSSVSPMSQVLRAAAAAVPRSTMRAAQPQFLAGPQPQFRATPQPQTQARTAAPQPQTQFRAAPQQQQVVGGVVMPAPAQPFRPPLPSLATGGTTPGVLKRTSDYRAAGSENDKQAAEGGPRRVTFSSGGGGGAAAVPRRISFV